MIKTNVETLVETSVMGEITHPTQSGSYSVGYDGSAFIPVGMSGITHNVKVGDPAFGWAWGDHIEPGVSIKNGDCKSNASLNTLACVGNVATVVQSAMDGKDLKVKGATGIVTGKHGGAEHVLVHFSKKVLDNLCIGDRIQIRATGVGLRLTDYSDVSVMNCSPALLKALAPTEKASKVRIQVTKIIPGKIMGSGLGSTTSFRGDYDIQSVSPEAIKEYSIDTIRIGDIVAITDHDCSYGPRWHEGAITIGVVIHGSSRLSGHGPGVMVLMTTPRGTIEPIITRKANIADLLGAN